MGKRRPSDVFLGCLCVFSGRAGLCHAQRWKRVGLESVLLQLAGSGLWPPPQLLAILPSDDSGGCLPYAPLLWSGVIVHTAELMGMISALRHAEPGHWNLFVADRSALFSLLRAASPRDVDASLLRSAHAPLACRVFWLLDRLRRGWSHSRMANASDFLP